MLETCCKLMVEAYEKGLMTSRDGNVSVRYSKDDHFWITPTNVRKHTLQPDQFKKLDIRLNEQTYQELDYTPISSNLKPSGEWPAHFLLQSRLPESCEQRVVMHVHSTYTVAAMEAGVKLEELNIRFPEIARYTRVAPSTNTVSPISWELGHAVASGLGLDDYGNIDYDIIGVPGHGVFAVDRTPWRAYEHIERLEHICKIVLISKGFSQ